MISICLALADSLWEQNEQCCFFLDYSTEFCKSLPLSMSKWDYWLHCIVYLCSYSGKKELSLKKSLGKYSWKEVLESFGEVIVNPLEWHPSFFCSIYPSKGTESNKVFNQQNQIVSGV